MAYRYIQLLTLLENIEHVCEYLLNVSDIEKKKSCFPSQAETSVRASDLSLAHYSTCTHCVCVECTHVCFHCCWGRRKKSSNSLCHFKHKKREEDRKTIRWLANEILPCGIHQNTPAIISMITAQLRSKRFQLDKNLGSTSQKAILSNMGMLPTLAEGKQMTQCCEMAPSHFRLHLVKATPHFCRNRSVYCTQNDYRRFPHL